MKEETRELKLEFEKSKKSIVRKDEEPAAKVEASEMSDSIMKYATLMNECDERIRKTEEQSL